MKRATMLIEVLLTAAALFTLATASARAQFITFVSGSGSNTAPCDTVATACTSLVGAYTQVRDGGIVKCAGPYHLAAGFTITKSVTIECSLGGGGIAVQSLTINAPGKNVTLRNLAVNCLGTCGLPAINIVAAATVSLENVQVGGAPAPQAGIRDSRAGPGMLLIADTFIEGNAGPGILVVPSSSTIAAVLDNVRSWRNSYGVAVGIGARVVITRSTFSWNGVSGVHSDTGGVIEVNDTLISHNETGIASLSGANITLSNSGINSNSTAITGVTRTYGNNRIFANSADGTPPTPVGGLSSENGLR